MKFEHHVILLPYNPTKILKPQYFPFESPVISSAFKARLTALVAQGDLSTLQFYSLPNQNGPYGLTDGRLSTLQFFRFQSIALFASDGGVV